MANWILNLPLTRIKLSIARLLYKGVRIFYRSDETTVERNGIRYSLDISEGFDLSLLLFGNFQKHVTQCKYIDLESEAVVFDVGANFGIMSLQYAKTIKQGHVHAFEPTYYAFKKLKRNLELNPELSGRISINQVFVSNRSAKKSALRAYSSWKVNGETASNIHPIHGGAIQTAHNVSSITLDDYCIERGVERVDFIKIDTDGHELNVLLGAQKIIMRWHPAIIFEIGTYVMSERGITFDRYLSFFEELGYELFDSKSGRPITRSNYEREIPVKSTIDVLCRWRGMPSAQTASLLNESARSC